MINARVFEQLVRLPYLLFYNELENTSLELDVYFHPDASTTAEELAKTMG